MQPLPTPSAAETSPHEIPAEELVKHRGNWVAFSSDGRRIVASCSTLKELDAQIRAMGEDPEEVLLDRIPFGIAINSGSELT